MKTSGMNRMELAAALAESVLEGMAWNTLYRLAYPSLTAPHSQMPEDEFLNAVRLDAPHLLDDEEDEEDE